ncbi:MAG: NAD(P)H-dependent oxidoreductase subunit E [Oscillospiraceae bacterium]|nr:NAD(P)H-dependent oxidoreductase subunit E [Oscillospiraceae bacterium]
MDWNLHEAVEYYKRQGAPGNQQTLIALLREMQTENGGAVPVPLLQEAARLLGVKETFLRAIIRRIPGIHLAEGHVLELCGGPNCSRSRALAACAEALGKEHGFTVRYVPCMRLCGKGPNLRWDGTVYHKADEALLRKLAGEK